MAALILSGCGGLDKFHELDRSGNGYSMNRSGQPKENNVEEICEVGIKKVFALNGEGRKYAEALKAKCPGAEVVYDIVQNPDGMVEKEFLQSFDLQVAEARAEGKGILFHCSCGCHRTGRLAAYYRMKYQGWSAQAAIEEMNDIGEDMDTHPNLPAQILGMEDYIHGRTCSQSPEFCYAPSTAVADSKSPNSKP